MKKILSLFCVLGLSIISASNVISCESSKKNQNNNSSMTLNELKSDFKNNNLTINNWDNFWGNLNDSFNNKTYYQLLLDQLFEQNNIKPKYEKDVFLQQKNKQGNYVKASTLNQMTEKGNALESDTNLRIHIMLDGDYANISFLDVNWKLTSDQQPIYPLFKDLIVNKEDQLNIYDTNILGYPDNKVQIKNYNEQLKVAFNQQYPNYYQYTNFTTSLANQTLNTNNASNKLGLGISNGQSHFTDNNFVINFYSISSTFNGLNDIYNNDPKNCVLGSWATQTYFNAFLRALARDHTYNCPQIMKYQNDLIIKDPLPLSGEPAKTITIKYKNEIMARVRAKCV